MVQKSTAPDLAQFSTDVLKAELQARRQLISSDPALGKANLSTYKHSEFIFKKSRCIIDKLKERLIRPDKNNIPLHKVCFKTAKPSASSLVFESIEHVFNKTNVLHDISFKVKAGELVCLVGPSGCGKTTLLHLASGIEKPTSGRILLNNNEVSGPNRFVPPEKRNIGFMFQAYALFPHLTVLQNIAYGLKGLSRKEATLKAMSVLAMVELEHYADKYPRILSGGQQQRVALARAIAPKPAVILMDEPFSGLDVYLRESLRQTTRRLLKEMCSTAIIVTHDPLEAMQIADRILVMKNGKIIQTGQADSLYRVPKDLFVARLFSKINEIEATVKNGAINMPFGCFPAPHFEEGEKVIFCIRQSAIKPYWKGTYGHVISTHFQGGFVELSISISGLAKPLTCLVQEDIAPSAGDNITIIVNPEGVMAFKVKH
ncbi:MAG: ABC transporter ATP-binding protein [Hyphomicrobiaceae bacterium]|nr:ABC transporter ATP-binding protein [Hyphomicrobiaceae bacterium]